MDPKFGLIVGAAVLTLLVLASLLFKPALADTDIRETTGVRLTAVTVPNQDATFAMLPTGVANGVIDFISSQIQAAIDSEKARYTAVYTGHFVISDFWDGDKPRYQSLTVQRVTGDQVASTFTIGLELTGDTKLGKILVRPSVARIDKAMAKLLKDHVFSLVTWFTGTTKLLNVQIQWKVEDLSGLTEKVTEASVEIAGYDMSTPGRDGHPNYFEGKGGKPAVVGVLDFPHAATAPGLYRVTVTVTEKDPINADRSVEADKTLAKDLIGALKKQVGAASA